MFDEKAYKKQWTKDNPGVSRKASLKYYRSHREERCKYRSEKVRKKRGYIQDYKLSHGCAVCGYNRCASALDFHHIGDDKEFTIGSMISRDYSLEKLKKEMDKCTVLCANCHRELHADFKVKEETDFMKEYIKDIKKIQKEHINGN